MIRPTLDRIATWRRRERLAVEMLAIGAKVSLTPEEARLHRRALVIQALEMRRMIHGFRGARP